MCIVDILWMGCCGLDPALHPRIIGNYTFPTQSQSGGRTCEPTPLQLQSRPLALYWSCKSKLNDACRGFSSLRQPIDISVAYWRCYLNSFIFSTSLFEHSHSHISLSTTTSSIYLLAFYNGRCQTPVHRRAAARNGPSRGRWTRTHRPMSISSMRDMDWYPFSRPPNKQNKTGVAQVIIRFGETASWVSTSHLLPRRWLLSG